MHQESRPGRARSVPVGPTGPGRRLRIATYNVHKCEGLDGRVRPDRIARVLREVGADVVALQEILSPWGEGREANQARFLADALGLEMQFGAVRTHHGAAYGNLILSALPLGRGGSYDLSVPGRERRGCLRADIHLGEGEVLHLYNVHLGTASAERRLQAPRLMAAVRSERDRLVGPRVVLGDFNEWTAGVTSRLLAGALRNVDGRGHLRRAGTYPALAPVLRIDHIYYAGTLELLEFAVHRTRTALVASDHLPLVANFASSPLIRARDGAIQERLAGRASGVIARLPELPKAR